MGNVHTTIFIAFATNISLRTIGDDIFNGAACLRVLQPIEQLFELVQELGSNYLRASSLLL